VLANTGFDTAGFGSAGLGLLLLGSALMLAARPRKVSTTA